MIRRYVASALVAPLGAVIVYGLLVFLRPLDERGATVPFLATIAVVAYVVEVLIAVPTLRALKRQWSFVVPASSVIGGVLVTQLIGIPAVTFGRWGSVHFDTTGTTYVSPVEALSAALVFVVVGLVKSLVFAESPHTAASAAVGARGFSRRCAAMLIIVSLSLWGAATLASPELTVYWRSPEQVEAFLRTRTPIGASQADVIRWLEARRRHPVVINANIPPNSDFPRTRTGGSAFIHETVAEYRLVFWAAIEAFYVFDGDGRLVDVRVRRTIDAL